LALGILGAAFSSGQLLFTPILMNLNMLAGWRISILTIVFLLGLVALPLVAVLMLDNPNLKGMKPYGAKGNTDTNLRPDPNPMRKAMAKPQFWLLAFSFGICGLTTSGLFQTHLIPHGIEHGFTEMTMAASLGLMGATDIFGTILSGWLCDRFGKRWPLAAYYLLRGRMPGRLEQAPVWIENRSLPSLLVGKHDWAGAWAFTPAGRPMFPLVPGGEIQRELAYRFGVNLVMYALLGDYKSDQLHVDTLLQQLGGGKP
jgi:MFS family permease